jgi:hypothetical protein
MIEINLDPHRVHPALGTGAGTDAASGTPTSGGARVHPWAPLFLLSALIPLHVGLHRVLEREIGDARVHVARLEADSLVRADAEDRVMGWRHELEALAAPLLSLQAMARDQGRWLDFLGDVAQMAPDGVRFLSLQAIASTGDETLAPRPLVLELDGTTPNLHTLLHFLESLSGADGVARVELLRSDSSGEGGGGFMVRIHEFPPQAPVVGS